MATRTNGLSHLEHRTQMCSINGSLSKSYQVVVFPRGRFWGHDDFCYTSTIFQTVYQIASRGCTLMTPTSYMHVTMQTIFSTNLTCAFIVLRNFLHQIAKHAANVQLQHAQNYQESLMNGEQGWRSDAENVHLTPM